jgi:hypothetical protein
MKRIQRVLLISGLGLLVFGFAGAQTNWLNKVDWATPSFAAKAQSEALPLRKTVPILIEGTEEQMVLYLHKAKPLGFYTYVPRDMVARSDAKTFTVHSRFQGKVNHNVKIQLIKMNHSSVGQAAEELKRKLKADGFSLSTPPNRRFGFAKQEYWIGKSGLVGRAAVFEYNDQPYAIYYHYPPEYADGFEPRLEIILDELVWYESQYK